MMIQSFPALPLSQEAEAVGVPDIAQNSIPQTPRFFHGRLDQGQQCLLEFQMLFRLNLQRDLDHDHELFPVVFYSG